MRARLAPIFKLTFPVFLGYVSVGFIFGLLVREIDQGVEYAFASAAFIYAGAAQFLLLNLVKTGSAPLQAFIAFFLLNARHVFYYAPVKQKLPQNKVAWLYSVLALTDETFAILTSDEAKPEDSLLIAIINQIYWIIGCTLGALAGFVLTTKIEGLDFALTALFLVLLIEKMDWRKDKRLLPALLALCVALRFLLPPSYFILLAIVLSLPVIILLRGDRHA